MDPVFARSESGPLSQFAPWIPLACIVASVIFTLAHLILTAGRVRQTVSKLCGISLNSAPTDGSRVGYHSASHQSVTPSLRSLVDLRGGGVFLWNGSRFFACITLTALSALIAVLVDGADTAVEAPLPSFRLLAYHLLDSHGGRASSSGSVTSNKVEIAWCIFYAYASILAALTLTVKSRVRGFVRNHLVALLLIAMIIGTWRELFPLATFNIQLASSIVTRLVWSRLCLLAFAAVVVPICVPRSFTPVDPKEPGEPSPEQTAPLISLLFYDFVTPLIWKAYRSTKIEYEQLPPLADYDRATFLKQRGLHQLDPTNHPKPRHLLRGIMIVFWREYCVMTIMVFIKVLAELAGPVSIRFLLRYIEDGAQPGYTRPWVWILWLLLGPVVGAAAMQRYVFTTTGMIVRLEAMITQLLFEHSLRIRVADHGSEGASAKTEIHGKNSQREAGKEEHKAPNSNSVGKIYNLMSVDLNNISGDFLFVHLFAPLRIGLNVYFLYWILDWSALIGLLAMIALLFIPGKVTHLIHSTQVHWAKKTDTRVQFIVETLNVIRTIKLFAWERRIKTQSEKKREDELRWYRKRQLLGLITMDINYALPLIVMIVTFASHTLWFKKPLDASTVFSSITVFDLLRTQLRLLFLQIPSTMQWAVSMKRTNDFLTKAGSTMNTELLDTYKAGSVAAASDGCLTPTSTIGFRNVDFTWGRSLPGTIPNPGQEFKLQIGGEVLFRPGKVNMVIGPTGCGKTSLLMALLGEMYTIHNGANSWVSLPREGGVAYAAQEAWIQNRTIRDNILFGSEYLDERYQKVLSQCALERDLELLEAGDQTEVGEKGVTISGGQKASFARISLARAIYSNANIIVLDDVFSALDVHTSRWIVDNCFRGDLVAGRTIIIVTHNVAMVSEIADFVVSIVDGRIASQGSVGDASRFRSKVKIEAEDQARENNGNQPEEGGPVERVPTPVIKKDGKLIVAEELAEGHVGWPALRLFLLAMGGIGFWVAYLAGFVLSNVTILLQTYWLGIWARAYDTSDNPKKVNVPFYLGVYGATCICGVILYSVAFIIHVSGSVRAARRIHDRLVASILGAPLYWINATPVGRIIARFTQDIRCVDGSLPNQMQSLVEMTIQLLSRFVAIIVVSPAFTFAGAILLVIGIWIGRVYIKAQLSVKRHMSNARSPMFSHFNAALAGIISIRAYGAEEQFRQEAQVRIDKYTRAARTFWNLNRWIAVRMDIIGAFFSAGLATYLVYFKTSISASDAGFSLNMAIALSGGILWWVRGLNEFEVQSNSLERIQDYLTIDQEPTAEPSKVPPAHWPSSGSIVVENLRASGISTSSINLDALRSSITIIPQHPDLLAGTIRENLDPFEEHDDAELNSALAAAGLSISLDASAQKVSLGQRQMVALARAMVRRSKVVVLDEATAAIDYETDAAIQRSIRTEMRDRTLIIVAHRLQTVCDADKIMVLEEGKIVEFDSPVALLRKDRGTFKALVDGSADRDALYAMVKGH